MKQSEIHTEKDFGKRSGSSSHYRINSGGFKVQLMAVTNGCESGVENEFLMCQIGYRYEFVVASVNGKETVKLFTLKDFIKQVYEGRNIPHVTIPFEKYANPDAFGSVVARHFFHLTPKNQTV